MCGRNLCSLILHRQTLNNLELPKLPLHSRLLGYDPRLPCSRPCSAGPAGQLSTTPVRAKSQDLCSPSSSVGAHAVYCRNSLITETDGVFRCTSCSLRRWQDNPEENCITAHIQPASWGIRWGDGTKGCQSLQFSLGPLLWWSVMFLRLVLLCLSCDCSCTLPSFCGYLSSAASYSTESS